MSETDTRFAISLRLKIGYCDNSCITGYSEKTLPQLAKTTIGKIIESNDEIQPPTEIQEYGNDPVVVTGSGRNTRFKKISQQQRIEFGYALLDVIQAPESPRYDVHQKGNLLLLNSILNYVEGFLPQETNELVAAN